MNLIVYIQNLFKPPIRILIGENRDFPSPTKISNVYYSPQAEGYPQDYFWIHTLIESAGGLVPFGSFESHPDWFALIDGQRDKNQVCFSSSLLDHVIQKVGTIQTDKIISISMGDSLKWCECERCKGKKPSETLITFVNEVARTYPNKKFSTLVYYQAQIPTIKPLSNVQIMLTTITVTKDEPIESGTRGEAIEFRRDLKAWRKLTSNIIIWDYVCNFRHLLMPYPNLFTTGENIKFYARCGVRDLIVQGNFGTGHEFSELKAHLVSSIINNPLQSVDKVINSFGSEYYGKAWPFIREYIDLLRSEMDKARVNKTAVHWLGNWADPQSYRNGYLSDVNLLMYLQILTKARLANDSIDVRTVLLQVLYTMIELGTAREAEFKMFRYICEELGEVTINEFNLNWQDYLKNNPFAIVNKI